MVDADPIKRTAGLPVTVKVRGQGGQRIGLLLRAPQSHCDWLVKRSIPLIQRGLCAVHVRLLAAVPLQTQLVLVWPSSCMNHGSYGRWSLHPNWQNQVAADS